jgi:hypothetical protein
VLCCAVLCCAVLCCAVLCCAVLCCRVPPVPQVYLSYPTAATDPAVPAKVLRYFKKVCATAGAGESLEKTAMTFTMTDRDVRTPAAVHSCFEPSACLS